MYVDRRNNRPINASNIIWILACNALDGVIVAYFDRRDVSTITCLETGHTVAAGLQDRLAHVLQAKFGVECPDIGLLLHH